MKFQSLVIDAVIPETADTYTLRFQPPTQAWLNYLPGQYLTLKVIIDGEQYRRAYSLSSSPQTDEYLAVTIKAIEHGKVSNYLKNNIRKGDSIECLPPMGNFVVHPDSANNHHYVLLGAGSGITPLMSILRTVLAAEPESIVSLIYGNRDEQSIVFRQALEDLKQKYQGRLSVHHVLSRPSERWDGVRGRVEGEVCQGLLTQVLNKDNRPYSVFICGPQGMMDSVEAVINQLNIPQNVVHREFYSAPVHNVEEDTTEEFELIPREVTFILDGVKRKVIVDPDSNILQAVIDLNVDPPYACQEGVCSTCRAKVHSGMVQMYVRDGLSDEEIEAGYVLTCQCVPLTDDVVVEFA
jgi:ring-1,2-phenylacetyl-CoA epoxidase subunit PaaE